MAIFKNNFIESSAEEYMLEFEIVKNIADSSSGLEDFYNKIEQYIFTIN